MGSDMAPVDGDNSAPVDHRPSRLREGVAAPRRPSLGLQGVRRVVLKAGLCLPGNRSVVPLWKPLFFMATPARRCKSGQRGIGRVNLEAEFDSEPVSVRAACWRRDNQGAAASLAEEPER
jgi:hypothetical protein